ncbi:DUF4097 family beta strand repeat-containing protein [Streptomyces zagrosensis]|uniref:DUF4097 domain-containing protein n=1 Tax=Streptomyces zagrosensis TaxID=1042984 RepID=A0A7W9QHF9_9ACTN|nr:DUF4097 family beta strand repeat-containing protein [Streptomyces zagrosensis]MBB5940089.1 hypothetical protein [Streptomyces zagrosensis]
MNPLPLTRSCFATVAAAVLSGALLTGCEGGAASNQETDTRSFTVSDKVTALSIEASGGDMEVTGDSGTTVRVTETITYTGDRPKTGRQVSDGRLSLSAGPDCGPIDDSDCDMTYQVKVPSTLLSVRLVERGGSIKLKNLAGAVEAHTTGGSLRADKLAGKSLVAKVSGGEMTGNFTKAPGKVDVDTNGGNVSVIVPSTASYAVDAKSAGGKSKVSVTTDPGSARTIKLRAVGGNVSLTS